MVVADSAHAVRRNRYIDPETGYLYLRARYYDPKTAQFLTPDPLYAATGSRYGYAGNDPVNMDDPNGLHCGKLGDPDFNQACLGTGGFDKNCDYSECPPPPPDSQTDIIMSLFTGQAPPYAEWCNKHPLAVRQLQEMRQASRLMEDWSKRPYRVPPSRTRHQGFWDASPGHICFGWRPGCVVSRKENLHACATEAAPSGLTAVFAGEIALGLIPVVEAGCFIGVVMSNWK